MIKSMTGFGTVQFELPNKTITIEIKSLNSKQLDLNLRTPPLYREKDMEIRSRLSQKLERGRIDFNLSVEVREEEDAYTINKSLALKYYDQLQDLAASIPGIAREADMFPIILRMPDVLKAEKEQLDESEWEKIEEGIDKALVDVDLFRVKEGAILEQDILGRIRIILGLMDQVGQFEQPRIDNLREKITNSLKEFSIANHDNNRLEQEMIFYLERLDITEEKVRLKKHCDYFIDTLHHENSAGKKLGFIAQEIGREINTLGSKANDAQIQKLVVQMKDELEKIKEQLFNIL